MIHVLDGLSGVIGVVEIFESVIWNSQFYALNDFELILPMTNEMLDLLEPGRYLVRDVDIKAGGEYRNVMQIENITISFAAEKGWLLKISGSGLKKIVGQRVVWSQTNFEAENVETAIRTVITDNIISPSITARKIDNFILDDAVGFSDTFDAQLFSEDIAKWIQDTCTTYGYGWDVYIKGGKYVFTLIKGTDRTYSQSAVDPVVFSPAYDNLSSAEYEYRKADFYNTALIGGEGEGTEKVTTSVGTATGLDRYETYVNGSQVSSNGEIITMQTYLSMLQTYGTEQLAGKATLEKFTGEIIQNGMYTLNEDYFLGDKVSIIFQGIRASSRVIELIYSEDANGISLLPTFAEWEV